MSKRSKRQLEIVEEMIEGALQSASEIEGDCGPFSAPYEGDEKADFIGSLSHWLEKQDAELLRALGISMAVDDDGQLVFRAAHKTRPFIVRAQMDRSIAIGGKIVLLDGDEPLLDQEVYDFVVERLLIWAGIPASKPGKWLS